MSTAPTICQLVHGLPVGGAEVLVSRMVRCLGDQYRFVVACLDEVGQLGETLAAEGSEVVLLGRRPGFDRKCIRQLGRLFRDKGVDLVHAHQYTPFAYALATRVFGRRPPVLFSEHGRFFPDRPSCKRKIFNRLMMNSRDRFVAVGNSVRQALIDNEGLPGDRIQVIYNGVNLAKSQAGTIERNEIRAALGLEDSDIVSLNVARLDPIKDHQTAIRALGIACRRNPAIRMLIAGDGHERPAIEEAIHNHHLEKRIRLLGMRDDVPRLLAAADLFLLTSVSEGVPVTVLEAMAAGIPVVATNVGGLPELVIDGKTGLLAPAGDAQRLAEAILHLAENSEIRAELAARAKCRLESEFSEAKMMASYSRLYAEMISNSPFTARRSHASNSAARSEPRTASTRPTASALSSRLARR